MWGQYIGLSIPHAREFLKHPGVSFNLFYPILSGKKGAKFMKDARAAGRNIYAWTVNDEQTMRYTMISTAFPKLLSTGIQLKLTYRGRFIRWTICKEIDGNYFFLFSAFSL